MRKERQANGKVKRIHEKAASSPSTRLLAHEGLSKTQRKALKHLLHVHDPITLRDRFASKLKAVCKLRKELQEADAEAAA